MADNLNPAELSLLARISAKEELRPFFLRKAKGLKWFDALEEQGYFNPASNPAPVPAKEEGYVSVPLWPAIEYLVATSPELLAEENLEYAERVLGIIREVTTAAMSKELGNYRTWLQFSKIIQNIPVSLISPSDLVYVDYWLEDKYERNLVSGEVGEKWLVALLEQPSSDASAIAVGLLKLLYKASFMLKWPGDSDRREASFRFSGWYAKEITEAVAAKSGEVLGQQAIQIYLKELERILEVLGLDGWSYLWRPAIEDHAQNHSVEDVEDILIVALRNSLKSYIREEHEGSKDLIAELLENSFQIIKRVAIYTIRQNFRQLNGLIERVIVKENFTEEVRHEVWHLLHDHYPFFPWSLRQRAREIVEEMVVEEDDGSIDLKATAYRQAIWYAALRNHDESLRKQYLECVTLAGAEPDHPDFPSYMSSGRAIHESPKTKEELLSISIDELVTFLNGYEDLGHFREPGLEGLVETLKAAAKAAPKRIYPHLEQFASLDCAFVYVLIEAFSDLWVEKAELPWDDMWRNVLNFCEAVIQREEFWSQEGTETRVRFVGNRYWVVGSIGRLIEKGVKSDDHAFSPQFLEQARSILLTLLEKESGEEFKPESDAVSIAVNCPRGRCLEAMINLALRYCRLEDQTGKGHEEAWNIVRPIFDEELTKPDVGEFEFITLLVNYLPNFLYMSTSWVLENLSRIFDRGNYQKWICAMQAYAYVNRVYEDVFNHLKASDHFVCALGDENLKEKVAEKIVQNIVIAYLSDYECVQDKSSLIRQLLSRCKTNELSFLIWFVWTLRNKNDSNIVGKVVELWPLLLEAIDTSNKEGQRLVSRLASWVVFIDKVDDSNRHLVLKVAEFADEDYNSHEVVELIARISLSQPKESAAIWLALLQSAAPEYPEEEIREALANLVKSGNDGRRDAYSIVDKYIKRGSERPSQLLEEIVG